LLPSQRRLGPRRWCLRRPAPVLLPGGPVHRPAFETRACSQNVRRGAGCAVSGQRRAPDQLTQRSVLRALLLPCRERLRADRAKQRPALGIDHGHDDLRAAGQIEHNPVQDRADTGYGHQIACGDRLHTTSLSRRDRTNGDRSTASVRYRSANRWAHYAFSTVSLARDHCTAGTMTWISRRPEAVRSMVPRHRRPQLKAPTRWEARSQRGDRADLGPRSVAVSPAIAVRRRRARRDRGRTQNHHVALSIYRVSRGSFLPADAAVVGDDPAGLLSGHSCSLGIGVADALPLDEDQHCHRDQQTACSHPRIRKSAPPGARDRQHRKRATISMPLQSLRRYRDRTK
jgi:hypothetical protein